MGLSRRDAPAADARRRGDELRPHGTDRLLLAALDVTSDAVFLKDLDGRYVVMNRPGAAMFGLTPDDMLGRRYCDFFDHASAVAVRQVDERVLALGQPVTVEEELVTALGRRTFHTTKGVYRGEDGRPVGIFGISRDITERRQAEDERRRLQQALEITVEGVSFLDGRGQFVWVNDSMARLCGYGPRELVGLPWSVLSPADDRLALSSAHAGMGAGDRVETEVWVIRKDGTGFHAELVTVASEADGRLDGYYCSLRDITDRKRAEEELRRTAAELERRNRELESFAYLAAHDLRQPLQVVGGFASLLSQLYPEALGERGDGYVQAINRGVDAMSAIVESLLEFARAGQAEPPECLTDTSQVVAEVVDGLQGALGGSVVVEGPLPVLPADPAQLTRLFQNLIGNSLKFRSEEEPVVQVSAERVGDDWCFTVQDNGIGISPAFTQHMFEMFQRERRSNQSGTGLGLAICKKIVEHHGGRIWFEPAPGRGSVFRFTLPAASDAG